MMNADGSGAQQLLSFGSQPDWTSRVSGGDGAFAGDRHGHPKRPALRPRKPPPSPQRLGGSATRAATATASLPGAVVTGDTLNVRTGPGTAYPKTGLLRKGDKVVVTGRTKAGDWLAVTLADGTTGWVSVFAGQSGRGGERRLRGAEHTETPDPGRHASRPFPPPRSPSTSRSPRSPRGARLSAPTGRHGRGIGGR